MTRPSRSGEVLLILFGVVFATAGIFFAGSFLFAAPGSIQGSRWAGVFFASVFILIGLGIACGAIYGTRKLKEQAAAAQANPDCPWLWRADWAARRAESRNRGTSVALWVAAIFWNLISFTVAAGVVPKLWRTSSPIALVPFGFCAIGLILAGAALRATIRRERFGRTYFEFASLPFSPGGSLKGTIHLRFNTETRHGVDLSLSCVRRTTTGSGENRTVNETVLWQADNNVPQAALMPSPMGDAAIPVEFAIPGDAYESNHDQTDDQVLWILHAQADVPGVNFSDDFEVPVFHLTPTAVPAFAATPSFLGDVQGTAAAPAFQSDASDVAKPENPKVVVSLGMNGGTEFYFPPFRNPSRFAVLFVFTTLWTGVVYFIRHSQGPWFFAVVFGLFEIPLIYALLQSALGSCRIEVGDGKIVYRRGLLGIGATHEIPFSEIAQILTVTAPQQSRTQASYSLFLYTKSGDRLTLADAIDNRQEARWLAAQLEKFAGLKLDTHVEVRGGFGVSGAPPQRGEAPSASTTTLRSNSPAAVAIGLAFFLAWMGFVGFQFFSHSHQQTKRLPKAAVPARSPLRQVTYSPLTDEDVERLQTLPDQAQAEELLARAIQHDSRALDLFEQNIGSWHNLRRTVRINDVEQRSLYSTDLRVRYANADLNLAVEGFAKTDSSAGQLIAQAQSDPAHRAYSVYYLGMLAGRGVSYDRIYPALVNYARNDPDPQVRQWAVEGMRYLGTDEALSQLFDSFTHDSSNAVRDRAGCNVSDCGNFMRKQRMRMVPRLLDLVADPQTSPQMRTWSFLALNEITDEKLPADASAWQNWYAQHGGEKLAEFERQDWWKVRGD